MKKIFTLFAATALAFAATAQSTTAKFGSADNSDKDTQVTCPGFTIAGTYVASGSAKVNVYNDDKGMKLRANKTGNTLILTVDENTTITALTMGIVTNDAEQSIPIIDVRVDDTSVALSYPIDTYNTTDADGSAVINLTDIEATENISILFDPANYTAKNQQVFIAGEVTYEIGNAAELPVFPDNFVVNTDSENVKIWQGSIKDITASGVEVDENAIEFATQFQAENAIVLSGNTDMEKINLEFTLPSEWSGIAPVKLNMQPMDDFYLLNTRANDFEPAPLDDFLESFNSMGLFDTKVVAPGNPLAFPLSAEPQYYFCYLYLHDDGTLAGDPAYAGDYVDSANSFLIVVNVNNEGETVEPTFPETIEYTINGEKELAGVDVVIKDSEYGPSMSVTGKSDAETIAITFAVPEGWEGWIINAEWAEVSEQPIAKTRSEEDWSSLEHKLNYEGYKKGNTVTFVVEEEDNWATLALYKGDKVYYKTIDIEYNVVPTGGVVATDPVFPEELVVDKFPEEDLEVEQHNEDGQIFIAVTGEIEESTFDVVLDVPEGWTGFISMPVESSDVTISDTNAGPRMAKVQEAEWVPVEDVLETEGVAKGNKFTFKANGTRQQVEVHLYKDDMVDVANFITLTANVKKKSTTSGVNGINAADNAAYYDLQGNKIAKPAKGMFVKVVDGKATKVVVK